MANEAMDVQIGLVSDQPVPNLIAALDPALTTRHVVLLATERMRSKAELLQAALLRRQRTVQVVDVADHRDLPAFRAVLQAVLREHGQAALNATGGTKLLALAAYEVFYAAGRPVFYVDTDNTLFWLHPQQAARRVPGVLDIETYFALFGERVQTSRREPLPDDGGLESLERLNKPSSPRDPAAVLKHSQRFESLVFRAMHKALATLGPDAGVHDLRWGVKTLGAPGDEYDVVLCRDNRLYLVETKLIKNAGALNSFLHKLDNLRSSHGLTAQGALVVSARLASSGGYAQRAAQRNLLLVRRDELSPSVLAPKLARWIGPGVNGTK